jgi:hypothetical protein
MSVRCGDWNLKIRNNKDIEEFDHQERKIENVLFHPSKVLDSILTLKNSIAVKYDDVFPR